MRKFSQRGFTSVVALGAILLILGVLAVAVYFLSTGRTSLSSRASSNPVVTASEEALSLTKIDLRLEILPVLPDKGSIGVSLKWQPITDPNFQYFTVAIYRASDYSVVPLAEEVNVGQGSAWKFPMLAVGNGDYYVHIKAVYKTGKPKLDRGKFSYFADGLSGITSAGNAKWLVGKGVDGSVVSAKNFGMKVTNSSKSSYVELFSYLDRPSYSLTSDFTKQVAFAMSVNSNNFSAANVDWSRAFFEYGDKVGNMFMVAQRQRSSGGDVYARQNVRKVSTEVGSVPTSGTSGTLMLVGVGGPISGYYNGQFVGVSNIGFRPGSFIRFGIQNFKPGLPDVNGAFANFRMIWSVLPTVSKTAPGGVVNGGLSVEDGAGGVPADPAAASPN